jgi:hypothetical protein
LDFRAVRWSIISQEFTVLQYPSSHIARTTGGLRVLTLAG